MKNSSLILELTTSDAGHPTASLTTVIGGIEHVQFTGPREWVETMRLEWYPGVAYTRVTVEAVAPTVAADREAAWVASH